MDWIHCAYLKTCSLLCFPLVQCSGSVQLVKYFHVVCVTLGYQCVYIQIHTYIYRYIYIYVYVCILYRSQAQVLVGAQIEARGHYSLTVAGP